MYDFLTRTVPDCRLAGPSPSSGRRLPLNLFLCARQWMHVQCEMTCLFSFLFLTSYLDFFLSFSTQFFTVAHTKSSSSWVSLPEKVSRMQLWTEGSSMPRDFRAREGERSLTRPLVRRLR